MADIEKLRKNLEDRGIRSSYFATAREAADYLDRQIDGTTVGIGGSMTVKAMGLYPRLSSHNRVVWHWEGGSLEEAAGTEVYLTSANGVAETGELVNIDGNCNRIASSVYGHKRVYFVVGINKIEPDYDRALWRGWPPRRTPSAWAEKPPVRSKATVAMTARARSGSAVDCR